jgi:hypothetical protein
MQTWSFTIDARAVGLVQDVATGRAIGTAFSFIRPRWYVTAKHVVVDYGEVRERLAVLRDQEPPTQARVLFLHPELDLAVLDLCRPSCERPLFPGHHAFAVTNGLLAAGYAPSKTDPNGGPVVYLTKIPTFEVQIRERPTFSEETVVFAASESEGGHSGGPVFGPGGGVVGAIIEHYREGETLMARATSIIPLLESLTFASAGS